MRFENKTVIVTGAGSGIGRSTAKLFAAEAAVVVCVDIDANAATETAKMITDSGGLASIACVDVTQSSQVKKMVEVITQEHGSLDVLFNNAGILTSGSVTQSDEQDWVHTFDVNLKGVMLCSKFSIPVMAESGGGVVINTASINAVVASISIAAYAASKGGLLMLTKQMALDYAPSNVRVNCVCPSDVNTPMIRHFIDTSIDPVATEARLRNRVPLGRLAEPEDIARAVLFLASDDAAFITGVALPVDGGVTAL